MNLKNAKHVSNYISEKGFKKFVMFVSKTNKLCHDLCTHHLQIIHKISVTQILIPFISVFLGGGGIVWPLAQLRHIAQVDVWKKNNGYVKEVF
jgi:hypothetical protein